MANSLQAQLLKAGLVSTEQVKRAQRQKRVDAKRGAAPKPAAPSPQQRERERRAERERARNEELQAQRARKERTAQIRQMIKDQRLDRRGGESAYQFVDGRMIRKLPMHEAQRLQVVKGTLAVVRYGQGFELVPPATAHKIAERDPGCVVVLNTQADAAPAADDPYADFPVPDDLMW
ncbi:DUF2058 domain-containing protein [Immundisolibacter sp.]|uniref:DUF2058 domain-containing protein n=1 Tax=Immundisolibacter sp. TaxID=1934948 RepID=UPI00356A3FD2